MNSARRGALIGLIGELLEEAEREIDGEIEDDTPLISSGLLDSLALLSLAEWISDERGKPLDLASVDVRTEWETVGAILTFVDRRA